METRRQSYRCPIFGRVEDIKGNVLPTYEDVMKCYEWNRLQLKISRNTVKQPSFLEVAELVSRRGEDIWRKSSLPTISQKRVIQLLKAHHLKCKNLIKSLKRLSVKHKNLFYRIVKFRSTFVNVNVKKLKFAVAQEKIRNPKKSRSFC